LIIRKLIVIGVTCENEYFLHFSLQSIRNVDDD